MLSPPLKCRSPSRPDGGPLTDPCQRAAPALTRICRPVIAVSRNACNIPLAPSEDLGGDWACRRHYRDLPDFRQRYRRANGEPRGECGGSAVFDGGLVAAVTTAFVFNHAISLCEILRFISSTGVVRGGCRSSRQSHARSFGVSNLSAVRSSRSKNRSSA